MTVIPLVFIIPFYLSSVSLSICLGKLFNQSDAVSFMICCFPEVSVLLNNKTQATPTAIIGLPVSSSWWIVMIPQEL